MSAIVERTTVPGHVVSTIKLSVNHGTDDAPVWYETYVFAADGDDITDWAERDGVRYRTREEAVKGHKAMVKKWLHTTPKRVVRPTQDGDDIGLVFAETFAGLAERAGL